MAFELCFSALLTATSLILHEIYLKYAVHKKKKKEKEGNTFEPE